MRSARSINLHRFRGDSDGGCAIGVPRHDFNMNAAVAIREKSKNRAQPDFRVPAVSFITSTSPMRFPSPIRRVSVFNFFPLYYAESEHSRSARTRRVFRAHGLIPIGHAVSNIPVVHNTI